MASYTGFILMKLQNENLPSFTWDDVKKLIDKTHGRKHEIIPEYIESMTRVGNFKYVYVIGRGGLPWLERCGLLNPDAHYIYSMWSGYKDKLAKEVVDKMRERGVPMTDTSGHADVPTLRRFVEAIKPKVLVPIHTFHPDQFPDLFGEYAKVELLNNNEPWEV
ncbi:MAG: hypothetical protein LBT45_03530 [Rickettsiales bacterium]|jgi:hypothetical protein|nr:hypothetical protein [Rickettsiales bacterium]